MKPFRCMNLNLIVSYILRQNEAQGRAFLYCGDCYRRVGLQRKVEVQLPCWKGRSRDHFPYRVCGVMDIYCYKPQYKVSFVEVELLQDLHTHFYQAFVLVVYVFVEGGVLRYSQEHL